MNLAVDQPWVLALLGFALLPFINSTLHPADYSWNRLLPGDIPSSLVNFALRLSGALAIALLILGISGVHFMEHQVERIGQGAHIVLLLDRSRSMDNTFAGRTPTGTEESKAHAARRLLAEFVVQRENDRIGVAGFSTAPIFSLPFSDNKDAVLAAINTLKLPGLAYTNISKGLAMALSFFKETSTSSKGSRIVLLVSDGAAVIDPDSEVKLRKWVEDYQARIYWIFLRTANSPSIYDKPEDPRDDNAAARPERYLHLFFKSLDVPYAVYEAENSRALQTAIADIDHLENLPMEYTETVPRKNFNTLCYTAALAFLGLLIAAKWMEVKRP